MVYCMAFPLLSDTAAARCAFSAAISAVRMRSLAAAAARLASRAAESAISSAIRASGLLLPASRVEINRAEL